MPNSINTLHPEEFPALLKEISDPPKILYYMGNLPKETNALLCVVGSRKMTAYARSVCESLISHLSGYPITIISGLALGIDSVAHKSALAAGLQTIAIPGSGLDKTVLYPRSHYNLAQEIIKQGGGLLSEFPPTQRAAPWTFPKRNRIMAGLSHAVLVIEAAEKSGTLITSRLATEYNRDVLTVPGSIFSSNSKGPHMLIRLGATPITCAADICEALGLESLEKDIESVESTCSKEEYALLTILKEPTSKDELSQKSSFSPSTLNQLLSLLEIKGLIQQINGKFSIRP